VIFESAKQYLKGLSSSEKAQVKDALKKFRAAGRGKGTKAGALFQNIDKGSSVGKAGGVTKQGGGTRRGD
jgi:hypothetical protein